MPPKKKAYLPPKAKQAMLSGRSTHDSCSSESSEGEAPPSTTTSSPVAAGSKKVVLQQVPKASSPTNSTTTVSNTARSLSAGSLSCRVLVPLDSNVPPQQAHLPIPLMRQLAVLPGSLVGLQRLVPRTKSEASDKMPSFYCILQVQPSNDISGNTIALNQSTADVTLQGAKEAVLVPIPSRPTSSAARINYLLGPARQATLRLIASDTKASVLKSAGSNVAVDVNAILQGIQTPSSLQIATQFRATYYNCLVFEGMFLELSWATKKFTLQVDKLEITSGTSTSSADCLVAGFIGPTTILAVQREEEPESEDAVVPPRAKEAVSEQPCMREQEPFITAWLQHLWHQQPWSAALKALLPLPRHLSMEGPLKSSPEHLPQHEPARQQLHHVLFYGESGYGKTFVMGFLRTCINFFSRVEANHEDEIQLLWQCADVKLHEFLVGGIEQSDAPSPFSSATNMGDEDSDQDEVERAGKQSNISPSSSSLKKIVAFRALLFRHLKQLSKKKSAPLTMVLLDDLHLLLSPNPTESPWAHQRALQEFAALMDECLTTYRAVLVGTVPHTCIGSQQQSGSHSRSSDDHFVLPSFLLRSGRFSLTIALDAPGSTPERYHMLLWMFYRKAKTNTSDFNTTRGVLEFEAHQSADPKLGDSSLPTSAAVDPPNASLVPLHYQRVLHTIAETTHGFIPRDLDQIFKIAAALCIARVDQASTTCFTDSANANPARLSDDLVESNASEYIHQSVLHDYNNQQARSKSPSCFRISAEDLIAAARRIRPTAIKSFEIAIPNVTWDDIGGSGEAKQVLQECLEWCRGGAATHPADTNATTPSSLSATQLKLRLFQHFGLTPPRGVLLYGPPGCSKTLLAKALAHESKMNFISIKGPEVFSKWVGDSEKAVRDLFRKARQASPCIVFIDELDGMCGVRGKGGGVSDRVISQFLTELDGLPSYTTNSKRHSNGQQQAIMLVAATNRPENIDPAVLRPGRIDRKLYIGLPDLRERLLIAKIGLKKLTFGEVPLDQGNKEEKKRLPTSTSPEQQETLKAAAVDFIAAKTEGYTGAEIIGVCKEAGFLAVSEALSSSGSEGGSLSLDDTAASLRVTMAHVEAALKAVPPQVTPQSVAWYKAWSLGGSAAPAARGHIATASSSSRTAGSSPVVVNASSLIPPLPQFVPGGFGQGPWAAQFGSHGNSSPDGHH